MLGVRAVRFRDGTGRPCVLVDRFDLEGVDRTHLEALPAVRALAVAGEALEDVEPGRLRRLLGAPPSFWGADEDGLVARVLEELHRGDAGRLVVLRERRRLLVSALPPPEPPAAPAPAPAPAANKPAAAATPAAKPAAPAPAPERKIEGKFDREKAKCGDEVFLLASSKNIPDGEAVTFSLTTDAGKAVDSAKDKLASSAAKTKWIAKGAPDQKTTFKVAAGGVSGDAPKPLVLHKYADVASDTKTIACTSGVYGWTGKFDIKLAAGVVHVTTKIKLLNRQGARPASGALPAVGAAVSDADKASMKADIEGKLSGKWLFHRDACQRKGKCDCDKGRACCMFKSEIHVEFVESGQHHDVNLFQGNARADSGNWTRVKTRPNSWAHETGHLLGYYDEYTGGAVGAAPRWKPNETSHVMNTGLTVPETYYWDFRDWLKAKLGESWALLKP